MSPRSPESVIAIDRGLFAEELSSAMQSFAGTNDGDYEKCGRPYQKELAETTGSIKPVQSQESSIFPGQGTDNKGR